MEQPGQMPTKQIPIEDQPQATSPMAKLGAERMTFYTAVEALIKGATITRIEWQNPEQYCFLGDGYLKIHRNNIDHNWLINDGDILATDWIIINKESE